MKIKFYYYICVSIYYMFINNKYNFIIAFHRCLATFVFLQLFSFTINCQQKNLPANGLIIDSLLEQSLKFSLKYEVDKSFDLVHLADSLSLEIKPFDSTLLFKISHVKGRIYQRKGELQKAKDNYLEGIHYFEQRSDTLNNVFAQIVYDLCRIYDSEYKLDSAYETLQRYITLTGILHPGETKEYGYGQFMLANIYVRTYRLDQAKVCFQNAKRVMENTIGKDHPDYAHCLNNYGAVCFRAGDVDLAEKLIMEGMKVRENYFGKKSMDYHHSLNNLGNLYTSQFDFIKGEKLYLEAGKILEDLGKTKTGQYAWILNNLGNNYIKMGDFSRGETYLLSSLSLKAELFGTSNFDYLTTLQNITALYLDYFFPDKALVYFKEAFSKIDTSDENIAHEHFWLLNNYGNYFYDIKEYEKGRQIHEKVLRIREKSFGMIHPDCAVSLSNLAYFYQVTENYGKALELKVKSDSILEVCLGRTGIVVRSKTDLSELYLLANQPLKAREALLAANEMQNNEIRYSANFLSEMQLQNYIKTFSKNLDHILSYNLEVDDTDTLYRQESMNSILLLKGFVLNLSRLINKVITDSQEESELLEEYRALHKMLGNEFSKPPAPRNGTQIDSMQYRIESIQKVLVSSFKNMHLENADTRILQKNLRKDEMVVEFVRFKSYKSGIEGDDVYGAFILNDKSKYPRFTKLFSEAELDSIITKNKTSNTEKIFELYSSRSNSKKHTSVKASLTDLIWQPLKPYFKQCKTAYICLTGNLHRINLSALPVSKTQTLSDICHVVFLGNSRDLLARSEFEYKKGEAALFGGIDFKNSDRNTEAELVLLAENGIVNSQQHRNQHLKGKNWEFLPETEKEIDSIGLKLTQNGFKVNYFKGRAASEEAFKMLGTNNQTSPQILHVATHGYFLPDKSESSDTILKVDNYQSGFNKSRQPLIRSGLILAGGDNGWNGQMKDQGIEDGVLTAFEIAQMNLSNTELVVLSACDTGLGDIQSIEGVYGLQRAFRIAGAKYLIMSLWKVPDYHTNQLMVLFYKNWLQKKVSIPDAFRQAQKEMRNQGWEAFYWAGFMLLE